MGATLEKTKQTSVMMEPTTKRRAHHAAIDLGMNFSGLTRGALKIVLVLLGSKGIRPTWRTKIVSLCNNPSEAPLVMTELVQEHCREKYPELMPHFEAIIRTMKNARNPK